MNDNIVGIGQLEVIDLALFDEMKAELQADLQAVKEEGKRHTCNVVIN